jgi:hypothetical protein
MTFTSDLVRIFGHFKTTSALSPLLVGGSILCLAAFGVTWLAGPSHPLTWMLWIFVMLWWLGAGGAYIFWSKTGPDRLQTEDYQLQRLQVLTDERHPGRTIEHQELTPNTAIKVLKK